MVLDGAGDEGAVGSGVVLTSHELANALAATGMPCASRGCIWMPDDAIGL